jgi:hypothetical protein
MGRRQVSIPSIGDKLADAKYVPLVCLGQIHPLSIHLYIKNIEIVITEKIITSGAS